MEVTLPSFLATPLYLRKIILVTIHSEGFPCPNRLGGLRDDLVVVINFNDNMQ